MMPLSILSCLLGLGGKKRAVNASHNQQPVVLAVLWCGFTKRQWLPVHRLTCIYAHGRIMGVVEGVEGPRMITCNGLIK